MLAYSAQDLILEPFAGARLRPDAGRDDQALGRAAWRRAARHDRWWRWPATFGRAAGRLPADLDASAAASASAVALVGPRRRGRWSGRAGRCGPRVFALGVANGVFAVAAIGSMMGLAGSGREAREGVRMGLWGAAQAVAFGLGGFSGTVAVDLARAALMRAGARPMRSVFASRGGAVPRRAPCSRPGRQPASGAWRPMYHCRRRLRGAASADGDGHDRPRPSMRGGRRRAGRAPRRPHDLARRGRRSLLLDRAGRIKPCGGAIPPRLIRDFAIPDGLLVARVTSARMVVARATAGRHADRRRLRRHGRPRGLRRVAARARRRRGRRPPHRHLRAA